MNKNVLLVLVVILIPIVVLGFVAVNGAKNIPHEEAENEEGATEEPPAETHVAAVPEVLSSSVLSYAPSFGASLQAIA